MLVDTTFIYALNDPETGECRYVGKADDPHDRLFGSRGHIKTCHKFNFHCANWIKSLIARGLKPLLEILQEVPDTEWELWERAWIKASREIGMDLTNATDGGDGVKNPSPEARKKLSDANLGEKNYWFGKTGAQHPRFGKPTRLGAKHSSDSVHKMRKKEPGASSGFHGVCWHKEMRKWRAHICFDNKTKHLGCFADEIEAAKAHDIAAKIYHGAHAVLNFPD